MLDEAGDPEIVTLLRKLGGLRPDTDPIYERGWTILTGRNLSRNLPRDEPSDTNEDEEEKTERK